MPDAVVSNLCTASYKYLFFFHAEDGIRDRDVTGVQTCALPIFPTDRECLDMGVQTCWQPNLPALRMAVIPNTLELTELWGSPALVEEARKHAHLQVRSEERRVGKEWRVVWSPGQSRNGVSELSD